LFDTLPELGTVDMILTSPPYYRQRAYSDDPREIGTEGDVSDYIVRLANILQADRFRGPLTAWIVVGDVYLRKSLQLIPERLAIALVESGWTLRNELVWHKPNALPQSASDRFTCSTERMLLLAKPSRGYYFNAKPLREPALWSHWGRQTARKSREGKTGGGWQSDDPDRRTYLAASGSRHPRDHWSIPTESYRGAHPAPFPLALAQKAITAGCPPRGHVLDPFSGSGTTLLAADRLGCRATGIDLVPTFLDLAIERLREASAAEFTTAQDRSMLGS
jgi:DNA modification methylase